MAADADAPRADAAPPSAAAYEQRAFTVPADATEVILVRHGASAAAVPDEPFDLLDGHSDPPLADAGIEQANAVAHRLALEKPSRLFATPLRRTQQTAAPLAARLGLEPEIVGDLREVFLGEWEGGEFRIRAHQGHPIVVRALQEERWDVIPGGETSEDFSERVGRGLRTILDAAAPGSTVAAFVHGGVIGELCAQATRSRPFAFIHADNGSLTRLVAFADGRLLLRSFNDIAHLPHG